MLNKLKEKPERIAQSVQRETHFFKNLLDSPVKTGAISPSGSALSKAMASYIPSNSSLPVLEIGPGTGAVTRHILDQGVTQEKLIAVEYSSDFCKLLRKNVPDATIIQGDGFAIKKTLHENLSVVPQFAAVVSSLPLLNSPKTKREALLAEILDLLDGNPFIQFSYGFRAPVEPSCGVALEKTPWIVRNIPPARVFVYRRARNI